MLLRYLKSLSYNSVAELRFNKKQIGMVIKKEYVAPKATVILVNHENDLLAGSKHGDVEGFTNGGLVGDPDDDFNEGE